MEINGRKREPVGLGTHGENYGNWMSAPVFYMVYGDAEPFGQYGFQIVELFVHVCGAFFVKCNDVLVFVRFHARHKGFAHAERISYFFFGDVVNILGFVAIAHNGNAVGISENGYSIIFSADNVVDIHVEVVGQLP